MNEENAPDVLSTLNDIKDLLTPKPSAPIQIQSNDLAALNANLDAIANGKAIVVPAEVQAPTYSPGVKRISRSDQRAVDANIDAIAAGTAVVVD